MNPQMAERGHHGRTMNALTAEQGCHGLNMNPQVTEQGYHDWHPLGFGFSGWR